MIALGGVGIEKIYVGTIEIPKMYLGSALVYSNDDAPILPYDAQVAYLQSSGSQYINLPLTASAGDFFAVGGEITPVYKNTNKYSIFSANPYQQCEARFYSLSNSVITYTSYMGNNSSGGGWGGTRDTSMTFEISTSGITKNGTYTALSRPLTAAITAFRLFGGYRDSNRYPVKIKSFYIKAGDTKLYDFIAVRKDGVGYLYDKVSGELFGNNGSGSFTYGSDV